MKQNLAKLLSILLVASLLFAFCACIPTPNEQPVKFQVTYTASDGGRIIGQTEQTVEQGKHATSVTAVADDGYTFEKWSDGLTSSTRQDRDVQKDIDVIATFTKQRDPNRITFDVDFKFGVVDNPIDKVTFVKNNVSATELPVPTREHFTFGGWYLGETQVSDEQGTILVGNEIIDSDETVIYAKWTANETFTYKVLVVYVTRVQARLQDYKGNWVDVNYTMSAQEEQFFRATTPHLKLYLDELLDGLVDFQVDEYFTTEILTEENFTTGGGPLAGYVTQALDAYNIPELLTANKLDEYDNIITVYGLQPSPSRGDKFHLEGGKASAKYAEVCFDNILFSLGASGVSLPEATECLQNHTKSEFWNAALYVESYWITSFVHELAHSIEMRVGLETYHDAVLPQTPANSHQKNKEFYLGETILNGQKVGIPYALWAGNIAKITITNKINNGENGSVSVVGNCGAIFSQTGIAYYEAIIGEEITITANPKSGYKLSHWSDGVTTPTRTETITGDLTLTATFELAEYTITVYPSEGGRISGYFEENGNTVWINNKTLTGIVIKGSSKFYVTASPNDGYRFVGWSNGETNSTLDFTFNPNSYFPDDLFDDTYTLILIPIFEKIEE